MDANDKWFVISLRREMHSKHQETIKCRKLFLVEV